MYRIILLFVTILWSCKPSPTTPISNSKAYNLQDSKPFLYEKYKGTEMCSGDFGCLVPNFRPISWSFDGKFAFITEPENEAYGGYNFKLIIQNMVTGSIEWKWSFEEGEQGNWDEVQRDSFESIIKKNKTLLSNALRKFNISEILFLPYSKQVLKHQLT